ncbi:hypothetical protein [Pseudomonas syringae group genomosp. 3]|nr:hypothetical protein [Pseudomonas syringae group genomosp. 3]
MKQMTFADAEFGNGRSSYAGVLRHSLCQPVTIVSDPRTPHFKPLADA